MHLDREYAKALLAEIIERRKEVAPDTPTVPRSVQGPDTTSPPSSGSGAKIAVFIAELRDKSLWPVSMSLDGGETEADLANRQAKELADLERERDALRAEIAAAFAAKADLVEVLQPFCGQAWLYRYHVPSTRIWCGVEGSDVRWSLSVGDLRAIQDAIAKPDDLVFLHDEADQVADLRRRAEKSEAQVDALTAKIDALCSKGQCGCSWDREDDVCEYHSPKLVAALDQTRRLREALHSIKATFESTPFVESTESNALFRRLFEINALARAALARHGAPDA